MSQIVQKLCCGLPWVLHFLFALGLWSVGTSKAFADPAVSLFVRATDEAGEDIVSVTRGEPFRLEIFGEDLREMPGGIFSAFFDVSYRSEHARLLGNVVIGPSFPVGQTDFILSSGHFDDVGGSAGLEPPGENPALLLSANFIAEAPGQLIYELQPADLVHHEVLLFGRDTRVSPDEVNYGSLSLQVVPEPATFVYACIGAAVAFCLARLGFLCRRSIVYQPPVR